MPNNTQNSHRTTRNAASTGSAASTTSTTPRNSSATEQQTHHASGVSARTDRERPLGGGRDIERNRSFQTGQSSQSGAVRQRGGTPALHSRNDPFGLMRRMAEDMDQLFEQFGFGPTGLMPGFASLGSRLHDSGHTSVSNRSSSALNTVWTPQVETFQRGDKLVIRADIPGVNKDDVHVELENDVLTISGERQDEHQEKGDGYFRSERSYGQFYRAIPLPEGISTERCDAVFKDGVLEVTLPAPKQEQRTPKRIPIK